MRRSLSLSAALLLLGPLGSNSIQAAPESGKPKPIAIGLYLDTDTNQYGTITCSLSTFADFQPVNPAMKWGNLTGQALAECDHYTWRMESTLAFSRPLGHITGRKETCDDEFLDTGHCGPMGYSYETQLGACGGDDPACAGTWIAYGTHTIDLAPTGTWLVYDEDSCTATGTRLQCSEEVIITSPY
ncbi:MAG: hypothetical protein ACLGH3_00905 [Actinomycetota bacterium]